MNFDYFVERADIFTEMARKASAFGKYPEVQQAYDELVNRVKRSGDVNLANANTQVRNRIYTQTQDNFLDETTVHIIKSKVMEFDSAVRRQMWYQLFAPIVINSIDEGRINESELIQFWNSLYNDEEQDLGESETSENSDGDSKMLSYISSDDSEDVSRLSSNRRIGANRRMKELTGGNSYPMSYLQYTKLFSYLEPRLKQALNQSRQLKRSKNPESNIETSKTNLKDPYADTQGWIEDAAETLKEGILSYKELYDSGEIEIDEIVDNSGRPDKLAQILVMWKQENFEKSLNDIVTSFAGLENKPSPEKFMEKMVSLSDKMADSGNKSASALFMALGREFKELYETEAPEDYTETDEQPYVGFDLRVLRKIFQGDGSELFKAWYDFRKALQDYNLEVLDFRRSNNLMDAKEKLRAFTSGENIPKSTNSGLTKAIIRQKAVIANMKDAGEDTTKEELRLQKMEASLSKEQSPEPKQQKNPYQKTIDDLQIKIQNAEEQLKYAEPEYATQLKQSIARMNAALESAYQQASDWQPVQESVLSYMTEQVNRDNKFSKQKGQFVDRGFKKVKNYNHWMIVNE